MAQHLKTGVCISRYRADYINAYGSADWQHFYARDISQGENLFKQQNEGISDLRITHVGYAPIADAQRDKQGGILC